MILAAIFELFDRFTYYICTSRMTLKKCALYVAQAFVCVSCRMLLASSQVFLIPFIFLVEYLVYVVIISKMMDEDGDDEDNDTFLGYDTQRNHFSSLIFFTSNIIRILCLGYGLAPSLMLVSLSETEAKVWLMSPAGYTCVMLVVCAVTCIPVLLANLVLCTGLTFGLIMIFFAAVVLGCLHDVMSVCIHISTSL